MLSRRDASAARPAVLLVCLATLCSGAELKVRAQRIEIDIDGRGHRYITWSGAAEGGNIVVNDADVQDGVVTSAGAFHSFPMDAGRSVVRRGVDPEFGPGTEAAVVGVLEEPAKQLKVERVTRILLPEAFPDVAIISAVYRNLGPHTLRLEAVHSQRILLDRRLADSRAKSYEFASFQGGAYRWGEDYALLRLHADFKQSNFQGVDDVRGPEGVGGGMPFIDVWGPSMGVAIAHLEKTPEWLSLPVEVRPDRSVEMSIVERPQQKYGQIEWLRPGSSYATVLTAVIFHRLDSYDALRTYGQLLRRRGVAIPDSSSDHAHEPYWKTWGWLENFTVEKMLAKLPELQSMGIKVANLDMGWWDHMGDWGLNRNPGKFPDADLDMKSLVDKIHTAGFKSSFWWYPMGADVKSRLAAERKDLLVQAEDGSYPLDVNSLYQLCPAYEPAIEHMRRILRRGISEWGFDGVYSDYQGLSAVPACFNSAHGHRSPLDSFRAVPKVFEMIDITLRQLKPGSLHEVCICSLPHSPYNMPFYGLANASDPVSAAQARIRIKAEKAIRGGTFPIGDCYQVPIQEWTGYSIPESFESAIGTGAQLTTFYAELDAAQVKTWTRWFHEYRELGLDRAEYLNLYDLAFDRPEVHVLKKGAELYYGIFADVWPKDRYKIELRGLEKGREYVVYDYVNRKELGKVSGNEPVLNIAFKDNLLIRLRPR